MRLENEFSTTRNLALNLAIHTKRGSNKRPIQIPSNSTPRQLAETIVRAYGGNNPEDITEIVDEHGRNLAEIPFSNCTFNELGIKDGETLDIQGDIIQGLR